jgi:hypothetical protein
VPEKRLSDFERIEKEEGGTGGARKFVAACARLGFRFDR